MSNSNIPYFKTWLIFTILTTALSALGGFAVGAIFGAILGAAGAPIKTIQIAGGVGGFVIGLITSFAMFRWAIDRYIVPAVTRISSTEG